MVHKAKAGLMVQRNERAGVSTSVVLGTPERNSQDRRAVALAYAARGWNGKRIADAIGVDDATICRWRSEQWWIDGMAAAVDRIIREPTALFNERVPAALEKLDVRMADDGRPDVQMRAVTEVSDRAFGKPAAVAGGGSSVVVNIVFAPSTLEGVNPYITYDSGDVVEGEAHAIEDA